jgi:hypothetical protein
MRYFGLLFEKLGYFFQNFWLPCLPVNQHLISGTEQSLSPLRQSGTVFTTLCYLFNFMAVHKARVFYYTKLERLACDKHSSLLGPFGSQEQNKVMYA